METAFTTTACQMHMSVDDSRCDDLSIAVNYLTSLILRKRIRDLFDLPACDQNILFPELLRRIYLCSLDRKSVV